MAILSVTWLRSLFLKKNLMVHNKIKKISQLKEIISRLKRNGKRIVFTNGCFDILHPGHVKYLQSAKAQGDILVVALNSDSSVKKIKGPSRPLVTEFDRACVLSALESIDFVTIFNEETPLNVIKKIKPDILVKGGDWKKSNIVGADFVRSYGGKVKVISYLKNHSTTGILEKIIKKFR